MKKTLALIIGSVIVIAFLAVFLASDEGAPVTTPIDTATTTAVVATTTLEKTELDLSEWRQFDAITSIFPGKSEFWYPAKWVVDEKNVCTKLGCTFIFSDADKEVMSVIYEYNKPEPVFLSEKHLLLRPYLTTQIESDRARTFEDVTLFGRQARKSTYSVDQSNGFNEISIYVFEINNVNKLYNYLYFSIDDTYYTNTEAIFNEIIARMKLGPIPDKAEEVPSIPTECHTVDRPDYCPEVHPSHNE
jgi:hypothetical protein